MGDAIPAELRQAAETWLAADPDPDTRAELASLLRRGDETAAAELADRFAGRLPFGTAGIRGPLGAGPARMNRLLVRWVTAGLARWLTARADDAARRGVVVGRDARHKSDLFADDTVRVLAGAGIPVHVFRPAVPTPLVAFAVRELDAAAGVQITASHNPPADNGYKVYTVGGAPLRPPADADVDDAVAAVTPPDGVALGDPDGPLVRAVPEKVVDAYVAAALRLPLDRRARDVRVVFTPLHGVAGALACRVLDEAGFADVRSVPAQAAPDPDFPTVADPNPERPGTLDRALALAGDVDADVVVATDPDGDRIAAAVPTADGHWRVLTGDEIGCVLADHLLALAPLEPRPFVATTTVSSRLLARIAEARGAAYAETPTGFKWLARVAEDAEGRGQRFVLAYEQALGVMVGDAVRDKDGITAAVVLADLVGRLRADGRRLEHALEDLARRFGLHATAARSLPVASRDAALAALDRIRGDPPAEISGIQVAAVGDYAAGTRTLADGTTETLPTPRTELLELTLTDGSRALARPSGTEGLLKCYLEVVEPVAPDESLPAARQRASGRLTALADAFVEALAP